MTTLLSQSTGQAHPPPFNRILSPIELKNLRFLVLDCPTDQSIAFYVEELKSRGVTDVVRVCEPTYKKSVFESVGIKVHDWPFKDGGIPSSEIINQFLALCEDRFPGGFASSAIESTKNSNQTGAARLDPIIAVHCVAGLGRAPVLVAIALIESGMSPLDTIEYVRRRRRGAFNTVQLQYLMETYKRSTGKKQRSGGSFFSNKRPSSPTNSSSSKDSHPEPLPTLHDGAAAQSSGNVSNGPKEATSLFGRIATKFKKTPLLVAT